MYARCVVPYLVPMTRRSVFLPIWVLTLDTCSSLLVPANMSHKGNTVPDTPHSHNASSNSIGSSSVPDTSLEERSSAGVYSHGGNVTSNSMGSSSLREFDCQNIRQVKWDISWGDATAHCWLLFPDLIGLRRFLDHIGSPDWSTQTQYWLKRAMCSLQKKWR